MFVFSLLPFPVRASPAPFLWVFYRALEALGDDVIFIGSSDYLTPPSNFVKANRQEVVGNFPKQHGYSVPSDAAIVTTRFISIPPELLEQYENRFSGNMRALFKAFLTEGDDLLQDWYRKTISLLMEEQKIEAVMTWCNCPSLLKASKILELPLIHLEQGPLRNPDYLNTAYFDFSGVNGKTECEQRYQEIGKSGVDACFPPLTQIELNRLFFLGDSNQHERERHIKGKVGVALQVEADSNIIAFSNSEDSQSLVNYAFSHFEAQDLLVRSHPHSQFRYGGGLPTHDPSQPVHDFLSLVSHIVTINSSVAVEALLFGKSATCLGDCPQRLLVSNTYSPASFTERLNFFLFNYLTPAALIFDKVYLRFRLGSPSEVEIQSRHRYRYLEERCGFENARFEVATTQRSIAIAAKDDALAKNRIYETEMGAQISGAYSRIDQLNSAITAATTDIDNLETALAHSRTAFEQLLKESSAKDENIRNQGEQFDSISELYKKLDSEAKDYRTELEICEAGNRDALAELESLKSSVDQIRTERGILAEQFDASEKDRLCTVASLEKAINEANQSRDALADSEESNEILLGRNRDLARELDAEREIKSSLDIQCLALKKANESLAHETSAHIDLLTAEINRSQNEVAHAQSAREMLTKELASLTAERESAIALANAAKDAKLCLHLELLEYQKSTERLAGTERLLNDQLCALEDELTRCKADNEELIAKHNAEQMCSNELRILVADREQSIESLLIDAQKNSGYLDCLHSQLAELEKILIEQRALHLADVKKMAALTDEFAIERSKLEFSIHYLSAENSKFHDTFIQYAHEVYDLSRAVGQGQKQLQALQIQMHESEQASATTHEAFSTRVAALHREIDILKDTQTISAWTLQAVMNDLANCRLSLIRANSELNICRNSYEGEKRKLHLSTESVAELTSKLSILRRQSNARSSLYKHMEMQIAARNSALSQVATEFGQLQKQVTRAVALVTPIFDNLQHLLSRQPMIAFALRRAINISQIEENLSMLAVLRSQTSKSSLDAEEIRSLTIDIVNTKPLLLADDSRNI